MELRKKMSNIFIKKLELKYNYTNFLTSWELRVMRKPTKIPDRREKCVSLICMQRFIVHIILLYLCFIYVYIDIKYKQHICSSRHKCVLIKRSFIILHHLFFQFFVHSNSIIICEKHLIVHQEDGICLKKYGKKCKGLFICPKNSYIQFHLLQLFHFWFLSISE